MANDNQVTNRTNNVYSRNNFIIECVDEGKPEIEKVISKNNSSDIMTKNLPVETFKQNGEMFLNSEILNEAITVEVDYENI